MKKNRNKDKALISYQNFPLSHQFGFLQHLFKETVIDWVKMTGRLGR